MSNKPTINGNRLDSPIYMLGKAVINIYLGGRAVHTLCENALQWLACRLMVVQLMDPSPGRVNKWHLIFDGATYVYES